MRLSKTFLSFLFALSVVVSSDAAILTVGPGSSAGLPARQYTTVCAAIAAATATTVNNGDTIEIDGATSTGTQIVYLDEGCYVPKSINLLGVGARQPAFDRTPGALLFMGQGYLLPNAGYFKAENIEFRNARCGYNCQPIWTSAILPLFHIKNCYIHDNDMGIILPNESTVLSPLPSDQRIMEAIVEDSELAYNGNNTGDTHNFYAGTIYKLTFRRNYSHDSFGGQLLKSRAYVSFVLYNRLCDSVGSGFSAFSGGMSNYESDFPFGGGLYYIGNIVCQGENTPATGQPTANNAMLTLYTEGNTYPALANSRNEYYITNNTFINRRADGTGRFILYYDASDRAQTRIIQNNIFAGPGDVLWEDGFPATTPSGNSVYSTIAAANFVNGAGFDFRLGPSSSAIDQGTTLGVQPPGGGANTMSLDPDKQYVHPRAERARTVVGAAMDHGALERTLEGAAYIGTVRLEARNDVGQVTLHYGFPATEAASLTGVRIYRSGTLVTTASANAASYIDTGGTPGVPYTYTVIPAGSPDGPVSNAVIAGGARAAAATLGSGSGWFYISSSNFASTCTGASCTNYWPYFSGSTTSAARVAASRRIYIFGGESSHNDNAVYYFDEATLAWVKHNNTDTMGTGETSSSDANRPGWRRLFQGMAPIDATGELYLFAGSLVNGSYSTRTWRYNPPANTWANATHSLSPAVGTPVGQATYNSTTQKVLLLTDGKIFEYTPGTGAYLHVKSVSSSWKSNLVHDPVNNRVYHIGEGLAQYYNPASSYATTTLAASCNPLKTLDYVAVDWDSSQGKVIVWDKSTTVYTIDPTTHACSTQTVVGEPSLATGMASNGFRYSPEAGGFFVLRNNDNVAFLRLAAASSGHTGGTLRVGAIVGGTP